MKKVNKLNEDVIRKLIVETLEEVSLGEGRKKKIKEVGVDPEAADNETPAVHAAGEELPGTAGHYDREYNENPEDIASMDARQQAFDVENFKKVFDNYEPIVQSALQAGGSAGADTIRGALKGLLDLVPDVKKK